MTTNALPTDAGPAGRIERDEILRLFELEAPVVSVYLQTRSSEPDADHRLDIRVRNALRDLDEQGVDSEFLDVIEQEAAAEGHDDGATRVIVADRHGVHHSGWLADPVSDDVAVAAATPRLLPVLASQQATVPHVVVLIDRAGADVHAFAEGTLVDQAIIEGDTEHIHRGHPGGWSQQRFQQRAENTWESNAGEVADHVVEVSEQIDAAVIIVAGDVRARSFLTEKLPTKWQDAVATIDGSRDDGSLEAIAEDAVRVVATAAAERLTDVLVNFREGLATGDAVEGAEATFAALRRGQVATLLVADDTVDDAPVTAWRGADPTLIASTEREAAMAGGQPMEAPRSDLAVYAAAAQDAAIVVVPAAGASSPTDGLGAILRFRLDD